MEEPEPLPVAAAICLPISGACLVAYLIEEGRDICGVVAFRQDLAHEDRAPAQEVA